MLESESAASQRACSLYKVKGRLTLTLKFELFNAETHKRRYLISLVMITRFTFYRYNKTNYIAISRLISEQEL